MLIRPLVILLAALLSACATMPQPEKRPPVFIPPSKPVAARPNPIPPAPSYINAPPSGMVEGIKGLWAAFPDRAGVAVARLDGSWMITHRGDEAMPQQSVSKLWVAITLMQAVDDGRIRLAEPVTVQKADLVVFSRAMEGLIDEDGYQTTIGDLLSRALTVSDNTANDFLLRKVGGPEAVRAMLSTKGLGGIRFSNGENALQAGTAGLPFRESYRQGQAFQRARATLSDETRLKAMNAYLDSPPDGASPAGIAKALLRLKKGELLSAASTQHLLSLMAMSETGKQRLRAGVPYDWSFAHKTGTGQDFKGRTAGYNDVGIMTAPDGTSYAVVVQIADTTQPVTDRMAFMQGISATVSANHRR